MQSLILATSAESPYSISKDLLSQYLGIEINEMQLYRITDHYGQELSAVLEANTALIPLGSPQDVIYAMADGSMVLTREEQWKEVKLGRIFTGKDCLQVEGKVNKIKASQYVSHLGSCNDFTRKMDMVLDGYENLGNRLIFINDGAVWLKNWITDAYPDAISILDFYHAKEYLCDFAKECFKDDRKRQTWISKQEERLLESRVDQVIQAVKVLNKKRHTPTATKLIDYYHSNITRMDYKYYLTLGKGIIGSGPIESAHRTVIQCRMKRSGQRWSKKGAANMLCLRTIKMNHQWDKVICLLKPKQSRTNAA